MEKSLGERYSELFYDWEQYGRGWLLADDTVKPEPPYLPFWLHLAKEGFGRQTIPDDGRKPGLKDHVKGLFRWIGGRKEQALETSLLFEDTDRLPIAIPNHSYPEQYKVIFPRNYRPRVDHVEALLLMLSESKYPFSFEIVGDRKSIFLQFTAKGGDRDYLVNQLQAFLPEAVILPEITPLHERWPSGDVPAIVDMGLSEEFMRPLLMPRSFQPDPLLGFFGVLEGLLEGELGILQVIFQGARKPWAKAIMESVTDTEGGNIFDDAPEMLKLAELKVSRPLFGAVIRVIGYGTTRQRSSNITRQLIRSLKSFDAHGSNFLIPLSNEGYPLEEHITNVFLRSSHRLGMLLNSLELAAFVHIPDASVQGEKLRGSDKPTHPAPPSKPDADFHLGTNIHQGQEQEVKLTTADRVRHMHIIGATGTGKSTLIRYLVQQDMEKGHGFAVLDPHGDLVEQIMERIPEDRIKDVVIIDPSDADYPVGINILAAHSELEKIVLSSDLVSVFRRVATSWGDQMTAVLSNAINAFLESRKGGTLLDLKRFLVEKDFREDFLQTVEDEEVVYFWEQEFPLLKGNTIASLVTRLSGFLRPKPIRNIMGQQKGLDFYTLMNEGKIILAKLSQGMIGEDNSYLLGTLLVAKIQQAAQSRQNLAAKDRRPFFLYIDEFQHFVTPSMSHILSGARKYGLGLILAHQGMQQIMHEQPEVGNAVLANAGTRMAFRLGDLDAKRLESSFAHFETRDLQNLQVGEAIVRIGQADQDCNVSTPMLPKLSDEEKEATKRKALEASRATYADSPIQQTKTQAPPSPAPEEKRPEPLRDEAEIEKKEEEKPSKTPDIDKTREYLAQQEKKKEHKRTQMLVKKLAEARGFKATIEAPADDGRVDVLLTYDHISIGVEISVTNTVQYEIQNIQKCLRAGINSVFMLSTNPKHLQAIQEEAKKALSKEDFAQTLYLHPDELAGVLNTISAEFSQKDKRVKGYKVKVNYATKSGSEEAAKRISKILLRSTRRKPKDQD